MSKAAWLQLRSSIQTASLCDFKPCFSVKNVLTVCLFLSPSTQLLVVFHFWKTIDISLRFLQGLSKCILYMPHICHCVLNEIISTISFKSGLRISIQMVSSGAILDETKNFIYRNSALHTYITAPSFLVTRVPNFGTNF